MYIFHITNNMKSQMDMKVKVKIRGIEKLVQNRKFIKCCEIEIISHGSEGKNKL